MVEIFVYALVDKNYNDSVRLYFLEEQSLQVELLVEASELA